MKAMKLMKAMKRNKADGGDDGPVAPRAMKAMKAMKVGGGSKTQKAIAAAGRMRDFCVKQEQEKEKAKKAPVVRLGNFLKAKPAANIPGRRGRNKMTFWTKAMKNGTVGEAHV